MEKRFQTIAICILAVNSIIALYLYAIETSSALKLEVARADIIQLKEVIDKKDKIIDVITYKYIEKYKDESLDCNNFKGEE